MNRGQKQRLERTGVSISLTSERLLICIESFTALVVAAGWIDRDVRFHRGDHAAFVDGVVARLAWPRSDAGRLSPYVHDPAGILRLRDARDFAMDPGDRRKAFSAATPTQRLLIPVGWTRFLHH